MSTISLLGYKKENKIKGTFISHSSKDWDKVIPIQKEFAKFIDPEADDYSLATLYTISKNNVVLGIPFFWGLSLDGGHFRLYVFGDISKKDFLKAKRRLKSSQIIASIQTKRVELVNWESPNKEFQVCKPPNWINCSNMNYLNGNRI
jgi:hypothetical protein